MAREILCNYEMNRIMSDYSFHKRFYYLEIIVKLNMNSAITWIYFQT